MGGLLTVGDDFVKEQHLNTEAAGYGISFDIYPVGGDVLAILRGGDEPHIGCAVLAVPRASLSGDGSTGCTSSVINVTGHKDEYICRPVAESLCKKYGRTVVCAGGFHADGLSKQGLEAVTAAARRLTGLVR